MACRLAAPILLTRNEAVAAEVSSAASACPRDAASQGQLDELVHDLGTWAAAVERGQTATAQSCHLATVVQPTLLAYARDVGFTAVAAWLALPLPEHAASEISAPPALLQPQDMLRQRRTGAAAGRAQQ
jgi:hypothetical protein